MGNGFRRLVSGSTLAVAFCLAAANGYQLLLLAAAASARPPAGPAPDGRRLRFVVLIPAHDEEELLPASLDAVAAQDYPGELVETVVVADNCSDATAEVARRAGARVLVRNDPSRPGKSQALSWALPQILDSCDAVVVLDADCVPTRNFLAAASAHLANGAAAAQSDDVVGNAGDSPSAALRAASFALLARVRAQGKEELGLSAGLFGTGMAFRREIVAAQPWHPDALDDGLDYHLQLVDAGVRVRFMPETQVVSHMPASAQASLGQQRRWEAGKLQSIRRWLPRLVGNGIRERDAAKLYAAFDLVVPPQSLLAVLSGGTLLASAGLGSRPLVRLAAMNVAAQALFVVGGLRVADASSGRLPAPARGAASDAAEARHLREAADR